MENENWRQKVGRWIINQTPAKSAADDNELQPIHQRLKIEHETGSGPDPGDYTTWKKEYMKPNFHNVEEN